MQVWGQPVSRGQNGLTRVPTSERGLQVRVIPCTSKGLGGLSAKLVSVLLALVHLHITPGLMRQRSWCRLGLGSKP